MSSEKVVPKKRNFITTGELLQAVFKNLDGKVAKEKIEKKIIDCGLSLEGKYLLVDIVDKISSHSSDKMCSQDEDDYEANWVEALRQLAVGLHDDEALQVIAAAKKSMEEAHSKVNMKNEKIHPRDLNNNLVQTSGGSFDSIRKADKDEQKKRESELLKIINDLKVQADPLTPTPSQDEQIDHETKT